MLYTLFNHFKVQQISVQESLYIRIIIYSYGL